jgi:thioredoxin-related protein
MKKIIVAAVGILVGCSVFASEGWMTDFDKAKEMAAKENKYILVDFSGSDWCGWCIRLDNEVFSKEAFKEYADQHLVLLLVDFPNDKSKLSDEQKQQNRQLAEKFNVRGFPTIFLLSPKGDVVAKTGYRDGGPNAYVEHLKSLINSTSGKISTDR